MTSSKTQPQAEKKRAKGKAPARRGKLRQQQAPIQTDEEINLEIAMLTQDAIKHFKLFRNPFMDDVRSVQDVFMSPDIRYVLASVLDTAKNQGFSAVIADSGAGKSVIRRLAIEELKKDGNITVIMPRIFDKTRVTAAGLCEAIIADISSENPKRSMESKARQVERLLRQASQSGQRHVMILEEAHDLTIPVLKYLKRFWEMEDGFSRLLGIVMVGQTELKEKLDLKRHYDMREVIRRVITAELSPLDSHLKPYLEFKFKRVGSQADKVFASDAYDAIRERLTRRVRGGGFISQVHPLAVHNLVIQAMNFATELGELKVNGEIVKEA